ncbi:MAG: DUF4760 domain-containing protein [Promethearchaeota archaeon]
MSNPTREDASLLLQLFGIMMGDLEFRKAWRWVFEELNIKNYDEFKQKYPLKSEENRMVRTFTGYMELLGTLVNKGLISENLIFDLWGSLSWEKLDTLVYGIRKDIGMPRYLENYEILAKKYKYWTEKNPPKV